MKTMTLGSEIPDMPMHPLLLSGNSYESVFVPVMFPLMVCLTQTLLLHHYHPTISLHARQLLSSQPVTASADLSLNTLSHFLDRFVYKNPKKAKSGVNSANVGAGKGKGTSAMQPAASAMDGTGVKLMKGEVGSLELMNGEKFLKRKLEDVPVDQVGFQFLISVCVVMYAIPWTGILSQIFLTEE